MDTAHIQSEFDQANEKLDRLEVLREGAADERYQGETDELAASKWEVLLVERKKWGDALVAQPGNDFVTQALGT